MPSYRYRPVGPIPATRLADAGMKVAIIERRFFGGTCVNAGCIPTETMVASAYAAHLARRSSEYGVQIPGPISVDMKLVHARMNEIRLSHRKGAEERLRNHKNLVSTLARGVSNPGRKWSIGNNVLTAARFLSMWARAPSSPRCRESIRSTTSLIHRFWRSITCRRTCRRWRQLHRPRVRTNVSTFRK